MGWKLFRNKLSKVKRGKMESCSKIKDGNGRLPMEEDELRRVWKDHLDDIFNIDTQEQVAVHMCGFDSIQRNN